MDILISFPDNVNLAPHETADILVEAAGIKYKVSVWTWDRVLTPQTRVLLEKDR